MRTEEEKEAVGAKIRRERMEILQQLEDWLEMPMVILSFVWLALFIWEIIWNLSPLLEILSTVIWMIFIVDFALKFVLAPDKIAYLKSSWLTAVALFLPALRVFRAFRVLRAARAVRGLRFVRLLTTLNRGMKAIGASFGRRGFGYVLILSGIVLFGGAAGMFGFENNVEGGFKTYAEALWWTAMMLTTIGSDYFPRTAEGRVLCFILALYAFTVFGYITATLATFFVESDKTETAGAPSLADLQIEIAGLRADIRQILTDKQNQIQ